MGLDMYLKEKKFIGANYEYRKVKGKIDIVVEGRKVNIPLEKVSSITLHIAYWRKANQIMKWFTMLPDWKEDEQEVQVNGEKLQELVETCKEVLQDHKKAEKLLPTMEGFFFGGVEYDEYYFNCLEHTIKQLESIEANTWYTFLASW